MRLIDATNHESPTIDAVEVVRCRDCLYWSKENEMCNAFDVVTPVMLLLLMMGTATLESCVRWNDGTD